MFEQMAWLMSASASLAEQDANPKAACLSHADIALESCSTVGQGKFPSEQSHMFYLLQVVLAACLTFVSSFREVKSHFSGAP